MLELANGKLLLEMWENASINVDGLTKVYMTNKVHDEAVEIEVSGSSVEIPGCLLTQEQDLLVYGEKEGKLVVNTIPVLYAEKPRNSKTKNPDEFHWVEKKEEAVKIVKNINEGISSGTNIAYFDAWIDFDQYEGSINSGDGIFTLYSDAKFVDLKEKFDSGVSVVFRIEEKSNEMLYNIFFVPIIQYGYDKEEKNHYLVGSQLINDGLVSIVIVLNDLYPDFQMNYFMPFNSEGINSLKVVKNVNRTRD